MNKHAVKKIQALDHRQRSRIIWAIVGAVAVLIFVCKVTSPQPSIAAYCRAYRTEKAYLTTLPGDTYPSGVFNEELSDASAFAASFAKLEKRAPAEIQPDVRTLERAYAVIHDDPSKAIAASLGAGMADDHVKAWTNAHCELE
jgi:hypothetical protein